MEEKNTVVRLTLMDATSSCGEFIGSPSFATLISPPLRTATKISKTPRPGCPEEAKYSFPSGETQGNITSTSVLMSLPMLRTCPNLPLASITAEYKSMPPYPPGLFEAKYKVRPSRLKAGVESHELGSFMLS